MNLRFIEDRYVRRLTQLIVLSIVYSMVALQFLFILIVWVKYLGRIEAYDLTWLATGLFSILVFPFEKEFASFTSVLIGIVPVIFSTVCFQYNNQVIPPVSVDKLNITGRICLLALCFGIAVGFVNVVLSGLAETAIDHLANGQAGRVAVRNLFAAILSFQLFYFVHLLGEKK